MLGKILVICVIPGILVLVFLLVCFGIAAVRVYKKRKAGIAEGQNGVPDEKIIIEDQVIAIITHDDGSKEVVKDDKYV